MAAGDQGGHAAPANEGSGAHAGPLTTYLCLGGGSALGAYVGGAVEAVLLRHIEPQVICGVSVGATVGAIVAGNRPEDRLPRLRAYWEAASSGQWPLPAGKPGTTTSQEGPFGLPGRALRSTRTASNAWHALNSLTFGRPGLFRPRWPGWMSLMPFMPPDPGLFDPRPLIDTLQRFINFDLLNRTGPRLLVHAVDVETGDPVCFDNRTGGITPEHLVAATCLPPGFPPMHIGSQWLVDAGLVANVPLDEPLFNASGRRLVLAIDPFCRPGPRPVSLDESMHRAQDLAFSAQTERTIAALQREHDRRAKACSATPGGTANGDDHIELLLASYRAPAQATGAKTLDFSERSLRERWQSGHDDMTQLLGSRDQQRAAYRSPTLEIHRNVASARAPRHVSGTGVAPAH